MNNANAKSHTHLQFAPANAKAKNRKRVCLPNNTSDRLVDGRKEQRRHNIGLAIWRLKCFYQSLCLVDNEVLRNRHLRVAAKRCTPF